MVWAGINADGRTPPVFIDSGVKIYQAIYERDILVPMRDSYGPSMFSEGGYIFQQDSAPAHLAKTPQDFCKHNFSQFITEKEWPSNSPDLNPLDYCVWSVLKSKVSSKQYKNVGFLKAALKEAWNELPQETLRAAVSAFPKRLRACVCDKGAHFESIR